MNDDKDILRWSPWQAAGWGVTVPEPCLDCLEYRLTEDNWCSFVETHKQHCITHGFDLRIAKDVQ